MKNIVSINIENETYYNAKNICNMLGIKNNRHAIGQHCHKKNVYKFKDLRKDKTNNKFRPHSSWLDRDGLTRLIMKARYVNEELIEFLDIELERKKIECVEGTIYRALDKSFPLTEIIRGYNIPKTRIIIDLFFPEHNIAIEIDEGDHKYYDKAKETAREMIIKSKYQLIRTNPDLDFNIFDLIGKINFIINNVV